MVLEHWGLLPPRTERPVQGLLGTSRDFVLAEGRSSPAESPVSLLIPEVPIGTRALLEVGRRSCDTRHDCDSTATARFAWTATCARAMGGTGETMLVESARCEGVPKGTEGTCRPGS